MHDNECRRNLCQRVVDEGLSVREVEKQAKAATSPPREQRASILPQGLVRELESRLQVALGTKVRIQPGRRTGSILIEYYGNDDLDRLVKLLAPHGS
jgi:ParB family chromosome partitioning protein